MIRTDVLWTGFTAGGIPVKEDDHIWNRRLIAVYPLVTFLKPIDTVITQSKLRNDTVTNIPALICTLGDKDGTPRYEVNITGAAIRNLDYEWNHLHFFYSNS